MSKPKTPLSSPNGHSSPPHRAVKADAPTAVVGGILVLVVALLILRLVLRRRHGPPPGSHAPLPEDRRLGAYTIQTLIADGGTASVYRGVDPAGGLVAIKVPHADQLLDRTFVATFQREAEIGVDLRHPSIVRVLEAGNYRRGPFPKIPYFVMEYLDGQELGAVLEQQGPLDPMAAAQIARSVADALDWAHHRGVVHRDISPRNVFITSKHAVKVMDFGISTVRSRTGSRAQKGKALNFGTPEYLAPERTSAGSSADERSDLYSLGCVFYEMVMGRPPFQAEKPQQVLMMHRKAKVERPSHVPARIETIILKLLEKDPKKRYQKAAEVTSDLAELIPVV